MAKTTPKRPRDANQLAKFIVGLATGDVLEADPLAGKNSKAVAAGRLGGKKGGNARAAALSAKQRKAVAKKAAAARWHKD